ncbi:MAG: hypothetical protein FJ265_02450 [Planctomycetes bacterium]|nr:hypothetical protein [Planctomycetota bacterium]
MVLVRRRHHGPRALAHLDHGRRRVGVDLRHGLPRHGQPDPGGLGRRAAAARQQQLRHAGPERPAVQLRGLQHQLLPEQLADRRLPAADRAADRVDAGRVHGRCRCSGDAVPDPDRPILCGSGALRAVPGVRSERGAVRPGRPQQRAVVHDRELTPGPAQGGVAFPGILGLTRSAAAATPLLRTSNQEFRVIPSSAPSLVALSLLAFALPAQTLVRDLAPANSQRSSNPSNIVDLNGVAIFAATTAHGAELWRSDGTIAGTTMLKDINPGFQGSVPSKLTVAGGYVFFTATLPGLGQELWRTDGTPAGTILLRDIYVGVGGGAPNELVALGNHVYFPAYDGSTGTELWRSDGTPAGTGLWYDIVPGTTGSSPAYMAVGGGYLFFSAYTQPNGTELWRSDGTLAGTVMVRDLNPGTSHTTFSSAMVGVGNGVYFTANDGQGAGYELHYSDGTFANTRLVKDIVPGAGSSYAYYMAPFGNRVLFQIDDMTGAGAEPWVSDGTAAGTFRLADLLPGAGSSSPYNFCQASPTRAVFSATNGVTGYELYVTDGTIAGTSLLLDLYPGGAGSSPDGIRRAFGGAVFSATTPGAGNELWFTDGTVAGTRMIADVVAGSPSSSPTNMAPVGTRVFCNAYSPLFGYELHVSDGTQAGTRFVNDLAPPTGDSSPQWFTPTNNGVVFFANDGSNSGMWRSDGTGAGTFQLTFAGQTSNYLYELTSLNGIAYATGYAGNFGYELLRTDGTQAGSSVLDVWAGVNSSSPSNLAPANGKVWFSAYAQGTGPEPHVTDGTLAGTVFLGDIYPGSSGSSPQYFSASGPSRVVFRTYSATYGDEPWVSDGTAAGTQLLLDIYPGASGSNSSNFLGVGNLTYFVATSPTTGRELWVTDGTAANTRVVADLNPGAGGSSPEQLVRLQNGTVLFVAWLSGAGYEILRTNGTAAGTVLVGEVIPGGGSATIQELVAVGNRAFFAVDDGVTGRELWTTDGASVTRVRDLYPGPANGVVAGTLRARPNSNTVIFAGSDGVDGLQIWTSDGTAANTRMAGKIGPWAGSGAVELGGFVEAGNDTWFVCDDGVTGKEPWRISSSGVVATTSIYGSGCYGTGFIVPAISAIGLPQLGNSSFGFGLANAAQNAFAALNVSFTASNIYIYGSCRLLLGQPVITCPGTLTSGTGTAAFPLAIPNNPSFAGVTLNGQWLVFDPNGSLFGFASLSNGLNVVMGN